MFAERLAALAIEREARRVHEDGGKIGKEIASLVEQLFLDRILDATRRESVLALLLHLLAKPGHGAVEMMKVQPFRAGNVVILHPGRAIAIRARCEYPMQGGNEDGALHRKFEGAVLQQIAQNIGDAEPIHILSNSKKQIDEREKCKYLGAVERALGDRVAAPNQARHEPCERSNHHPDPCGANFHWPAREAVGNREGAEKHVIIDNSKQSGDDAQSYA